MEIRYRACNQGLPPQPIKLKIPGWAGDSHDHNNGAKPQPWMCPPFIEGSTYALELIYPFKTECHVINRDGIAIFEGDWAGEKNESMQQWPPFQAFAPGHYGFTSSLDIVGPPGHVVRVESHPCYYTDVTWTSPCVVPGHLQTEWWPRIFFIVFKTPPVGQTHIFRLRHPYAQILFLPKKPNYEINPMTFDEMQERSELDAKIEKSQHLAENSWKDHAGSYFNDKYKVLSRLFTKNGAEAVKDAIRKDCLHST